MLDYNNTNTTAWLLNMKDSSEATPDTPSATTLDSNAPESKLILYFLTYDSAFKLEIPFLPYLLILQNENSTNLPSILKKHFPFIHSIQSSEKLDLNANNHLNSPPINALKVTTKNTSQLSLLKSKLSKLSHLFSDIREFDINYYVRAAIDLDLRVGSWYDISSIQNNIQIKKTDIIKRPDPTVLAFDIETTKMPLKFPDVLIDQIMMISYMVDGRGYLITNREIVSSDIDDFEYTPAPSYPGPFTIFNEANEENVLRKFFKHVKELDPMIFVTYNGDFFDWPFVEGRAAVYGMDMRNEIGVYKSEKDEFYHADYAVHMDAFMWVKRDSYLPQGSQGLKAVTKEKLGYNPTEIDPEDMTSEDPQTLSQYSVSDAVATYYLYMKYVHPFIFSLCNIIPMNPDDVLRKGSGTLCEALLMVMFVNSLVEAYRAKILMPNKHVEKSGKLFQGHLLESETYVGGHVEALEAGVFRKDLDVQFRLVPSAYQKLIDEIDRALEFSIVVENKLKKEDVVNYDEVKSMIVTQLGILRDSPNEMRKPLIYHLDVAAMYPNIILTNRLQPDAIVNETQCASCNFYKGPETSCQRRMVWSWRGEYYPAKRNEYNMIKHQLEKEMFAHPQTKVMRSFHDLKPFEQNELIKKRVDEYSRKIYGKKYEHTVIEKEDIVCQRENSFYVDTVRNFRDRRYTYKGLLKTWKKKCETVEILNDRSALEEAQKMVVVYDSLQLAHKCILNSFYGYVMRKGARWYSMEMAGIVCLTGSKIIQLARSRIEQLGKPLELDTDGIWCVLPESFPENFVLKLSNGKSAYISYPCSMLNHLVHAEFTNHQYLDFKNGENGPEYECHSENSIFFEVDGPYRAMMLPSSTEQDKLLKKRYAVFNDDGSLAELKGFEVKRRGELKLIKIFQTAIFEMFLEGSTLIECYESVAAVANQWLDILDNKASTLDDYEVFDLLSENRSMSKSLEEYGSQKSTSISTAKRLSEFLGDSMVKDKGLNCKFIISQKPIGIPVSDRAIPVSIFQAEDSVKKYYLRKWLKDSSLVNFDIRSIIDWEYYLERFGSVIQKIITIPAAMQGVSNPVPRIKHPSWLHKRISALEEKFKQKKITDLFAPREIGGDDGHDSDFDPENLPDMEDICNSTPIIKAPNVPVFHKNIKTNSKRKEFVESDEEETGPIPDPEEDYAGWIQRQKKKWRKTKVDRKLNEGMLKKTNGPVGRTEEFFRKQTISILQETWQILQICETSISGEFNIWALVAGALYAIKLTVPRLLYLNSKAEKPENMTSIESLRISKSNKTLPRSHTCYNLFELEMTESFYRENSETFSKMFNHCDIEGVYEGQVPLLFRALLNVGYMVSIEDRRIKSGRGIDDGFHISELNHVSDTKKEYLKNSNLHILYLFHAGRGKRQVYSLFSSVTGRCAVVFVDAAKNRDAVPNINRVYVEKKQEREAQREDQTQTQYQQNSQENTKNCDLTFNYPDSLTVSLSVTSNDSEAILAVNQALREYQSEKRGPTLIVLQSSKTSTLMRSMGLTMLDDFPNISAQSHRKDNSFPPVGWQNIAIRRMMLHFLNVNSYMKERIELSRYSDVPIGNLETDYPIFLADLFFARRLYRAEMLLWYSTSSRPDLGGREQDDNQFELEEMSNPECNKPGTYSNVCVEVDIFNLACNTILQSNYINEVDGSCEIEGVAGAPNFMEDQFKGKSKPKAATVSLSTYDETHINYKTFKILKEMVQFWSKQVEAKKNKFSEMMLEHLFRWLTTSSASMYDPQLFLVIHQLMRKVFLLLESEFQQLGSEIVYSSFEKLVVSTCKNTIQRGVVYFQHVIKSIAQKVLYLHIEISASQFWNHLIWMDRYNYGGVVCQDPQKYLEFTEDVCDDNNIAIEMQWNILEFLPPILHQDFQKFIAQYVYHANDQKTKNATKKVNENSAANSTKMFLQAFVNTKMKRNLLKFVATIDKKLSDDSPPPNQFPILPGSHLDLHNPALEFTKYIVAILELDLRIEKEVRLLKKDMLKVIGVREFSNEAKFINPCESLKLSQIICEYCCLTRDMDLTRDKDLLPVHQFEEKENEDESGENKYVTVLKEWLCSGCGTEYNRLSIEQKLIEMVTKRLLIWQLQDLKCVQCKGVKATHLQQRCECSGQFVSMLSRPEFMRKFKVFSNIAKFYEMKMLQEVMEFVIEKA